MATIELRGVSHIGIRVKDASVSEAFFARLGFEVIARHEEGGVVILKEPGGIEINLIVNGDDPAPKNVLMDVEAKHAGYTHVALTVADLEQTRAALAAEGIELSGGPVRLGAGTSLFIRDPDRNVIELRQPD